MSIGCGCFGVSTAAKVPVKRYNLLVPAIFPVVEPPAERPVSVGTDKNIKRLSEYLERNEHRIPKVSRRLARRLHADLAHNNLGFVGVAVAAYSHLVTFEGGKFARLYSKELIERYPTKHRHFYNIMSGSALGRLPPNTAHLGSVVGDLLSNSDDLAQRRGLDLLVAFTKLQNTAEFVSQLEAFVPLLCEKASSHQKAVEAVPSIAAASLRALLEHLRFCSRVAYVSRHLDTILYTVLSVAEAAVAATGIPKTVAATTATEGEEGVDGQGRQVTMLPRPSIGSQVGNSHSVGIAALLVYEELGRMTGDAAEGRKVVEFLLRFLDEKPQRWLGGAAVEAGLGVLRQAFSEPQHRYLLATMLIAHAGQTRVMLTPPQRVAVLAQAAKDCEQLEEGAAAAALLLALLDLPGPLAAASLANIDSNGKQGIVEASVTAENIVELRQQTFSLIKILAVNVGHRPQLTSVLGSALSQIDKEDDENRAVAALECCEHAAEAYLQLPQVFMGKTTTMAVERGKNGSRGNDGVPLPPARVAQHLSEVMLRAALGLCIKQHGVNGHNRQRVLAHRVLQRALGAVPPGAYHRQALLILSAVFHEVALIDTTPSEFVALEQTFSKVLSVSTDYETQRQACLMVLALQTEAAVNVGDGYRASAGEETRGSRLAALSAARRAAVLTLCRVLWSTLADTLKHRGLLTLQPQGVPKLVNLTLEEKERHQSAGQLSLCVSAVDDGDAVFSSEDEHISSVECSSVSVVGTQESLKVLAGVTAFKHHHKTAAADENGPSSSKVFVPVAASMVALPGSTIKQQSVGGNTVAKTERAQRFVAAFEASHVRQSEENAAAVPLQEENELIAANVDDGLQLEAGMQKGGEAVPKMTLRDVLAEVENAISAS